MGVKCAVCKTEYSQDVKKCNVCGFTDDEHGIDGHFPTTVDLQNWMETKVEPYRRQWEAKKREDGLSAQLEESRKREAELKAQLEEAKKRGRISTQPPKKSPAIAIILGCVGFAIGIAVMSIIKLQPTQPAPEPAGISLEQSEQQPASEPTDISLEQSEQQPASESADPTPEQPAFEQQHGQTQTAGTQQRPRLAGFVWINGGTFMMGSPEDELERYNHETRHQVTVSGFYMGKYEVTQKEYLLVMGTIPSHFKGLDLPVENVTWYDAVEYCNRLSLKEGLTPAYLITSVSDSTANLSISWNRAANGYRLPTEAEWEYACRAGTTTPFSTGINISTEQANFDGSYLYNNYVKGEYRKKTTPVGSFAPNGWGLCDMHGNVFEWCWDWFGDYSSAEQTDPEGPPSGAFRTIRGGNFITTAQNLRSARRNYFYPSSTSYIIGFRLVRP